MAERVDLTVSELTRIGDKLAELLSPDLASRVDVVLSVSGRDFDTLREDLVSCSREVSYSRPPISSDHLPLTVFSSGTRFLVYKDIARNFLRKCGVWQPKELEAIKLRWDLHLPPSSHGTWQFDMRRLMDMTEELQGVILRDTPMKIPPEPTARPVTSLIEDLELAFGTVTEELDQVKGRVSALYKKLADATSSLADLRVSTSSRSE